MKYKILNLESQKDNFLLSVKLVNLGNINYFAGSTNSGKSLLLDTLFEQYPNIAKISDSLQYYNYWNKPYKKLENFVDSRTIVLDILKFNIAKDDIDFEKVNNETKKVIQDFGYYEMIMVHRPPTQKFSKFSPYENSKVYNFIFWTLFLNIKSNICEFVIDEPEVHLHPYISKVFPLLLEYLSDQYSFQFFVATHSPFILSSVARLTYEETKVKQTVYFLENGHLIDKYGKVSPNARSGYWGQKLIPVANRLLGSGIEDLYIEQYVKPSHDSPILVLCEGQNGDEDAKIYNIIFRDLSPRVLFVSCKGSSQLYRSFQLLNEVKPGLSGNFRILMIRDRDAEFVTRESIEQWEKDHEGARILTKRAIECYLFNSETAISLCKKYNLQATNLERLDRLQVNIAREVHMGIKTSKYKEDLKAVFNQCTHFLLETKVVFTEHYETLAKLITPDTQNYKDLLQDIFM